MGEPAIIEVRNVSRTFVAGSLVTEALRCIDLSIGQGEFVSLVGRSGCGKSTLLNLLAGLDAPSSGNITLGGEPVTGPSARVGFVFQRPVLLSWRTVADNILLPVEVGRLPRQPYVKKTEALLDLVGLNGFAHHYPDELSGGMQQRVSLARALICDPDILLMDEPFGALDAITREQMDLELQRIWQASGKTVVFVTHDIAEAVFLSDRVILMTPRPGTIREVVPLSLPRPRTVETPFLPEFVAAHRRIRQQMN
jgi:NitT/TauT family transport system ATP-binding protein